FVQNEGGEAQTDVQVTAPIPEGTTLVEGSTRVSLSPAVIAIVADDFESGTLEGSAGLNPWTGPWTPTGASGGAEFLSDDEAASMVISVGAPTTAVTRTVDLSSFPAAYLTYRYKRTDLPGTATFAVEMARAGDESFARVDALAGAGSGFTEPIYQTQTIDITRFISEASEIRFVTDGPNLPDGAGFRLDQVTITSIPPAGTTGPHPEVASGFTLLPGDELTVSYAVVVNQELGEQTEFVAGVAVTSAEDGDPRSAEVTVELNQPPVAVDDAAETAPGQAVSIDVLANDTDPNGESLVVLEVGAPQNGFTVPNDDGTITYQPAAGYLGEAAFAYTISDGLGEIAIGTVIVIVTDSPAIQSTTATGPAPLLTAAAWRAVMPPDTPNLPLTFEQNVGQADPALDFIARGQGYIVTLEGGDAVLSLGNGNSGHEVRMNFIDGQADPQVIVWDPLADRSADGRPLYASVGYTDVYPGIDVLYAANGRELEYSFLVNSGGDPASIVLAFTGANSLAIENDGTLLIDSRAGRDLTATAPFTYQEIDGNHVPVDSRYLLNDDGTIGFTVGAYNPALPLIIDPTFKSADTTGNSKTTQITLTKPAGIAVDDLLIAQIMIDIDDVTFTPPAGWTLIREDDYIGNSVAQVLFYKVATGSEPADYTFTFDKSEDNVGSISAFSGVDTSIPIDAHGGQMALSGNPIAPSITTTVRNTLLVGFFGVDEVVTYTPPPGMTELWDFNTGAKPSISAADEDFAGPGPTGTRTATPSATQKNIAQLVALRPAASGGAPTAVAGGPYGIAEGDDDLVLDGSGSSDPDLDTLTYNWDLNNDLTYGDVTGINPTVPWATLQSFGIDDDGGPFTIGLEVDDGNGNTATDTAQLTVTNTPPTILTTGTGTATAGVPYTLNLSVSDPGADTVTEWVINWGDMVETIPGNPSSVTHTYTATGLTYNILASVNDEDSPVGEPWHQDQLLATSTTASSVFRVAPTSGVPLGQFGVGDQNWPVAPIIGPDGLLYVAGYNSANVVRYNPQTGDPGSTFVLAGDGGLLQPLAMAFGPDGNLYVADNAGNAVRRYSSANGAWIDNFIPAGLGGLQGATGLLFTDRGTLLVSSWFTDSVKEYNVSTRAYMGNFVLPAAGGLGNPEGLALGPDGNLYVASYNKNAVYRYDINTGLGGVFAVQGTSGLSNPIGLQFGPDGHLYVAGLNANRIQRYDRSSGAFVDLYVAAGAGGFNGAAGLTFIPGHQVTVSAAGTHSISGSVFEDIAGDVLNDGTIGDANNPGAVGVDVYLYEDTDHNNALTVGVNDTLIAGPVATDASGAYSFSGLPDETYFVRVDSRTVPSAQDPATPVGDVWAVQTYGPAGGACANGSGSAPERGTPGPCYAGITGILSDSSTMPLHRARIVLSGSDVSNQDFGFSFNVVVNTRGGNAVDDDGGNNRTVQGSLRQFIQNANAISGANAMRFVPVEPPNATDGTNDWWRIDVTAVLPTVIDADTSIDGTAYDLFDGSTVRDTNTAQIGAGQAVGVDSLITTSRLDPELAIRNDRSTPVARGLDFQSNGGVLRNFSIYGFGTGGLDTDLRIGDNGGGPIVDGVIVENVVVGTDPASNGNPGPDITPYVGVLVSRSTNGIFRDSLVRAVDGYGFRLGLTSTGWQITGNEFSGNGTNGSSAAFLLTSTGATITGNLFDSNTAEALIISSDGQGTIDNNTFDVNGGYGIALFSTAVGSVVSENVITNNGGGISVSDPANQNRLTQNVFGGNDSNAIDLTDGAVGGITVNSDTPPSCGYNVGVLGNDGIDAPIVSTATPGDVTGTACAGATVEVYRAVADGDGSDTLTGTDYGEGVEYLGSAVADGVTGAWSLSGITALVGGDAVSAIAINGSSSTSEFGANFLVADSLVVNSTGDGDDANPGNGVCETATPGQCTLRAAIEEANAFAGADTITFNIPITDPGYSAAPVGFTIQPGVGSPLPAISQQVSIDGTTQPEYTTESRPVIEIDGSLAAGNGLEILASNSEIRGLVINRFTTGIAVLGGDGSIIAGNYLGPDVTGLAGEVGNTNEGLEVDGATNTVIGGSTPADRNVISGNRLRGIAIDTDSPATAGTQILRNYIGTDAAGAAALPYNNTPSYQQIGLYVLDSPSGVIGTSAAGNLISGNAWYGIYIWGANATGNKIQGNIIGLDALATNPVPNAFDTPPRAGILLSNAPGNTVGGIGAGEGNIISGNGDVGLVVGGASSTGNAILGNQMYDNVDLGIDLNNDGVTLNDLVPGDLDSGPNDLLNFPVITAASESAGTVTVDFDLDVPAGNYRIEFFSNMAA
ncbi:MAG: right-handed parallel beta-helix repeat-containing protein, partial [Acidimicrobiia bacterium]|nr:right-handed parallel beta-helix repeat-containing protein [Acidimicrobiia bacterium]